MATGPLPPQSGSRVRRESRATALNSMRMEKGSPDLQVADDPGGGQVAHPVVADGPLIPQALEGGHRVLNRRGQVVEVHLEQVDPVELPRRCRLRRQAARTASGRRLGGAPSGEPTLVATITSSRKGRTASPSTASASP